MKFLIVFLLPATLVFAATKKSSKLEVGRVSYILMQVFEDFHENK